jgi:hypothetical protein
MPANRYEFVDHWHIPHPIGEVWDTLVRTWEFPLWWRGVYLEARVLNPSDEPAVGMRTEALARGKLPYKLRATFEHTRLERPALIEFKASGDFNTDSSRWLLKEAQDGGTDVTLEWNPVVDQPVVRLLSPIVKPLFRSNHRWAMKRGESQLTEYLAARKADGKG